MDGLRQFRPVAVSCAHYSSLCSQNVHNQIMQFLSTYQHFQIKAERFGKPLLRNQDSCVRLPWLAGCQLHRTQGYGPRQLAAVPPDQNYPADKLPNRPTPRLLRQAAHNGHHTVAELHGPTKHDMDSLPAALERANVQLSHDDEPTSASDCSQPSRAEQPTATVLPTTASSLAATLGQSVTAVRLASSERHQC